MWCCEFLDLETDAAEDWDCDLFPRSWTFPAVRECCNQDTLSCARTLSPLAAWGGDGRGREGTIATLPCVLSKVMMAEGTVGTQTHRWQGRPIDHCINRCVVVALNTAGESACQRAVPSIRAELQLSAARWHPYIVSPAWRQLLWIGGAMCSFCDFSCFPDVHHHQKMIYCFMGSRFYLTRQPQHQLQRYCHRLDFTLCNSRH